MTRILVVGLVVLLGFSPSLSFEAAAAVPGPMPVELLHQALDQDEEQAVTAWAMTMWELNQATPTEQLAWTEELLSRYEARYGKDSKGTYLLRRMTAVYKGALGRRDEAAREVVALASEMQRKARTDPSFRTTLNSPMHRPSPIPVELVHRAIETGDPLATQEWVVRSSELTGLPLDEGIASMRDLLGRYQADYGKYSKGAFALKTMLASRLVLRGKVEEAESLLIDALAWLEGNPRIDIDVRVSLSMTYAQLLCSVGRSEECLIQARRGLELIHTANTTARGARQPLSNRLFMARLGLTGFVADVHMQQGRWSEAEGVIRHMLRSDTDVPLFASSGWRNNNLLLTRFFVALANQPDKLDEAERVLHQLRIALARSANRSTSYFHGLYNVLEAFLRVRQGRYQESLEQANSLQDDKAAQLLGEKVAALRNYILARGTRRTLGPEQSLPYARSSTAAIGGQSEHAGMLAVRLLFDDRLAVEENLLALADIRGAAKTREAFVLIQKARNSEVGKAISQMSARFAKGDSELAQLVRDQQDLARQEKSLRRQLLDSISGATERPAAHLEPVIRDVQSRLESINKHLADRYPDYTELTKPSPAAPEMIQSLLKPDQALLTWFIGTETSWGVVARPDGTTVVRIPTDVAGLLPKASSVRQAAAMDTRGFAAFPAQKSFELYEVLLAPLMSNLKGIRQVYVVPDAAFSHLPLSLLLTKRPGKAFINPDDVRAFNQAPWLIREFAISVLPSISSLRSFKEARHMATDRQAFLGIGDPLLADHPTLNKEHSARKPTRSVGPVAFRGVLAKIEEIASLPSLPETAEELTRIGKTLSSDGGTLKLRADATESTTKSLDLSRYRVMAFATHGIVGGEFQGSSEPGLVLTPPAVATAEDDGLLTASEVAHLNLNADWVLLSACNTAAPAGTQSGEGMSGLAKAFFYAGARTLLVSHWPVSSVATLELTTHTIENTTKTSDSRAEAHRQAMLTMISSNDAQLAHPSAWAAFQVVGAGD